MPSIQYYSGLLYHGHTVIIGPYDNLDQDETFEVEPPSEVDPKVGFDEGITATQTVELHRALSAWLGMHRRLHPQWHKDYVRRDPGNKRRTP